MAMNTKQADTALLEQAMAHARAGRAGAAARILAQFPAAQLPLPMLCMRAQLRLHSDGAVAAREDIEVAQSRAPDDPRVADLLASLAMSGGDVDTATALLEAALRRDPRRPRLWYRFGVVLHAAGRYQAALEAHERALALAPDQPEPRISRASVWQIQGRFDDARRELEAVLSQHPDHPDAVVALAAQLEISGETDAGLTLLEPLVTRGQSDPALMLVRARLLRRAGRADKALALLEALDQARLDANQHARVLFLLGELKDQAGRYDQAFGHFKQANELLPGRFDAARYRQRIHAIRNAWTRSAMSRLADLGRSDDGKPDPIFVVGMPRSGTTLVERLLARHPAVHGAGELPGISDIERRLRDGGLVPDPAQLAVEPLRPLADAYLVSAGAGGRARFTDKMPGNFLHLGLIQTLLPRARVIHCRRHPLDTGLSCFAQDFSALGLAWSRRLEHIADYYQGYRSLMDHWVAVLDLPLLNIDYETLVAEPEPCTRRMLEFLGLGWDPACLQPDQGETASTASYAQVTQPIYRSSVGRHRHYAAQLASLAGRLGIETDER